MSGSVQEIKDKVEEFRQPAAARANAVAQCDVDIAAGPTSLDPSQTSFFQALGISTKIQKGAHTCFLVSVVHIIIQAR